MVIKSLINESNNLEIFLEGKIDTSNADSVFESIYKIIEDNNGKDLEFNFNDVEYISSVGLRGFLKIKKMNPKKNILFKEVSITVYEVFYITGFTEIFEINRRLDTVSLAGLEKIGEGSTGEVYRLSDDKVIKVYNKNVKYEDVRKEEEVSKKALACGIDTAITYDIVKVDDKYAIVYELINAQTYERFMLEHLDDVEKCAKEFARFVKKQHNIVLDSSDFIEAKEQLIKDCDKVLNYTDEEREKVKEIIRAVPDSDRFVHGDINLANVMKEGDEYFLIDMGETKYGHPVFDIAWLYILFYYRFEKNFREKDVGRNKVPKSFWKTFIREYYEENSEEKIKSYEKYLAILGMIMHVSFGLKIPIPGLMDDVKEHLCDLIKDEIPAFPKDLV